MGVSISCMTRSRRFQDLVRLLENFATEEFDGAEALHEACDMTSTAGYDNDGSTGPELIDNGVALALGARDYGSDREVTIFYAYGNNDIDQVCYYCYGYDEDDMLARFRAVGEIKRIEAAAEI